MKIIIVGATGTLGKKITPVLAQRHEVIKVGRSNGDLNIDIDDTDTIEAMFKHIGSFDALVSVTGNGHFGPLQNTTDIDFRKGINSKLMGQVNLVLIGQHYINPKGSFTLTSGILAEDPVINGVNLSTVNGAINGFVTGAAVELTDGVRINAVSPGVVEDSPGYFPYFPGHIPVTMDRVIAAYIKAVEGPLTGQVIKVY